MRAFATRSSLFRGRRPWTRIEGGRNRPVTELRFSPLPDGSGVYVLRDVTERADYEAKLAQRTAVLEATLENMGEGILVYGPDGKLVTRNDLAPQLLGLPNALFEPGAALEQALRFRRRPRRVRRCGDPTRGSSNAWLSSCGGAVEPDDPDPRRSHDRNAFPSDARRG